MELEPKGGVETNEQDEDRSSYKGDVWHVEGTVAERIVATACCYLESTNVQGGELAFRTSVHEPDYEQGDDTGVQLMYNLVNEGPLLQPLGLPCVTKEGRILAWPNTKQHCVQPVSLVDPTKPGKRTILCFFLVDPTLRIRSTATVPPQQLAWVQEGVYNPALTELESELALRQQIATLWLRPWRPRPEPLLPRIVYSRMNKPVNDGCVSWKNEVMTRRAMATFKKGTLLVVSCEPFLCANTKPTADLK